IGSSKRWPQSSQAMSTSFGLIVTVPGTRAMSSNPYATLAFRPRPTHIPIGAPPLSQSPVPCPRSPYIGIGLVPAYYISYEYTRRPPRVSTRGRRGVRFLVEDAEPHEPTVVVHALAPRVHAVERRRGAEVDDNDRRPIQNARGERVHIAVGADLTRRVHVERHPRVHSRLDDERRLAEVLLAHPLERLLDGWHDVR